MKAVKYQVFISSPFRKLESKRKAAVEAIVNHGQIPVALENFSAHASKDYQVIEKAIRDCQIYVLILGHTCGSVTGTFGNTPAASNDILEINVRDPGMFIG